MDKLSFGNYGSETFNDIPFSAAKGYTDPQSEAEARNQLSYPLNEIQEFVNDTVPINSDNQAVQLFITEDNKLKYRTAQGGILIDVGTNDSSIPSGGTTGQVLRKRSNDDHDVEWGSADKMNPDAEVIATGDSLVFYDTSASKIAKSSVQFDGSTVNQFLSKKGTFEEAHASGIIDVENILLARTKTISKLEYTATEDCIAIMQTNHDTENATINDVAFTPDTTWQGAMLLKSGDKLTLFAHGSWNHTLIVFGLRS